MLEKIIGAKSKVKILRKMFESEDREYCLEDLVKATEKSFGTVHPSLKSLVESRIVLVRKIGKSKLYRVNTRHVLYEKIKELMLEEKNSFITIAKEFSDGLKKIHIKNVILFGSVARGDFGEKSDIDILLIYSRSKPEDDVIENMRALLDKYDVEIVPTFLSITEVRDRLKKSDPFMMGILDEGKVLYGDAKWLGK
ncbi:MAG: nucleotidyltransferase domain-containing protein [Thermoplasmata archaeon]